MEKIWFKAGINISVALKQSFSFGYSGFSYPPDASYGIYIVDKRHIRELPPEILAEKLVIGVLENEDDITEFRDLPANKIIRLPKQKIHSFLREAVNSLVQVCSLPENNAKIDALIFEMQSLLSNIDKTAALMHKYLFERRAIPEENCFKVNLIYRELLTNAVRHGNKMLPDKTIKIEIFHLTEKKLLQLSVRDEGNGFDYFGQLHSNLNDDLLRVNHRGVFLISALSESVFSEGNSVTVLIKLDKPII